MKIVYASDLHIEINRQTHPELFKVSGDVLVLAGDIFTAHAVKEYRTDKDSMVVKKALFKLRDEVFTKFKKVIFITGNHEYYHEYLHSADKIIRDFFRKNNFSNVIFLDNSSVIIDDVAFYGGTLWVDIVNPLDALNVEQGLNDFRYIYKKDFSNTTYTEREESKAIGSTFAVPIKVNDVSVLHKDYLVHLMEFFEKTKTLKQIVISHHAPHLMSLNRRHAGNGLDAAYATNLQAHILNHNPLYWIHGHTHQSVDYACGLTRIVSSQAGYKMYEMGQWKDFVPGEIIV